MHGTGRVNLEKNVRPGLHAWVCTYSQNNWSTSLIWAIHRHQNCTSLKFHDQEQTIQLETQGFLFPSDMQTAKKKTYWLGKKYGEI